MVFCDGARGQLTVNDPDTDANICHPQTEHGSLILAAALETSDGSFLGTVVAMSAKR